MVWDKYIKIGVTEDEHKQIKTKLGAAGLSFQDVGYRLWIDWLKRGMERAGPDPPQPNRSRYLPENEEFHDLLEKILVGGKPGERAGLLLLLRNTAGDSRPSPRASRKHHVSGG